MEREETIGIIKSFVKSGLVPSRGTENYLFSGNFVNCFEHACLNLTNKQLETLYLDKNSRCIFDIAGLNNSKVEDNLYAFIKEIGLEIEKSNSDSIKLRKNQWLIARYSIMKEGYHFALLEKDGSWTAKEGFGQHLSHFDKLPQSYINPNTSDPYLNELEQLYIITNPYAESE